LVSEFIVSRVGRLIGAPVCENGIVEVPNELAGWEFRPGSALVAGFGHASLAVDSAHESRSLEHRSNDDNARRHVGVYALHDWCWGEDVQWLYSASADERIFSHDHGYYFPPYGAGWNTSELVSKVLEPHFGRWPSAGLDASEIERVAGAIEGVTGADIERILQEVPASWPITDDELETVGYFLEERAPGVAARIRELARTLP